MSAALFGEGSALLARVEAALAPLHAAVAPHRFRLGDLQVQVERSLPEGVEPVLAWSIQEASRAGVRVVAYLAEAADPRPSVRITLVYTLADAASGKPRLLDAAESARVAAFCA
ncbi:hypothetical protein [Niveibacterium microcysteis]|uniref:Uncharacterized protein n=1 Tax=Niveibacterium microcysteis TaxID=2811415 RepID=A0ABX7M553_9RHOO|nr:hypothetical protein [Niveibacterium microcysteis]QSI76899.1 hypothetical protein JY500_21025 [Niveibacterium microcysteis]